MELTEEPGKTTKLVTAADGDNNWRQLQTNAAWNASTTADASDDGRRSTDDWHDANARPAATADSHPTPDATPANHSKFKHPA